MWPPKNFQALTKDQKLLELEFAALSLKRSITSGCGPVDRATLIDEFNFLALPGTVSLSPRKISVPSVKSRIYLYYTIKDIANGKSNSENDISVLDFLEHGSGQRNKRWDSLIQTIDAAGIPLRLTE